MYRKKNNTKRWAEWRDIERERKTRDKWLYHIIPYARALVGPFRSHFVIFFDADFVFIDIDVQFNFIIVSLFSITCQARINSKNILLYRTNYWVNIKSILCWLCF